MFLVLHASEQAVIGYAYANGNGQFLISTLLNLLQIKYQNSVNLPFDTHATIMLLFIVATYVYAVALMAITRPISNRNYHRIVILICDISGVLSVYLLVLILIPLFGWFLLVVCAFALIRVLYGSYRQIFELLYAFTVQVYRTLKQIFKPSHQASNGNTIEQEGNGGVPTIV